LRRILKWAATCTALAFAALWPLTYWRCALWEPPSERRFAALVRGQLVWYELSGVTVLTEARFHNGLFVGTIEAAGLESIPNRWLPSWNPTSGQPTLVVPLWMPLLLSLGPALVLWHTDLTRRRWARLS